jgi:hypothetical protein
MTASYPLMAMLKVVRSEPPVGSGTITLMTARCWLLAPAISRHLLLVEIDHLCSAIRRRIEIVFYPILCAAAGKVRARIGRNISRQRRSRAGGRCRRRRIHRAAGGRCAGRLASSRRSGSIGRARRQRERQQQSACPNQHTQYRSVHTLPRFLQRGFGLIFLMVSL